MSILCEVCGNEFNKGKYISKRPDGVYIACPYCRHENKRVEKPKKKRGK